MSARWQKSHFWQHWFNNTGKKPRDQRRSSCTLESPKPTALKPGRKIHGTRSPESPPPLPQTHIMVWLGEKFQLPATSWREKQKSGMCIQHYDFSRSCLRAWFLSCLNISAVGNRAPGWPLRTKLTFPRVCSTTDDTRESSWVETSKPLQLGDHPYKPRKNACPEKAFEVARTASQPDRKRFSLY